MRVCKGVRGCEDVRVHAQKHWISTSLPSSHKPLFPTPIPPTPPFTLFLASFPGLPHFRSSVCVQYNTRKQKSVKNREGLGTRLLSSLFPSTFPLFPSLSSLPLSFSSISSPPPSFPSSLPHTPSVILSVERTSVVREVNSSSSSSSSSSPADVSEFSTSSSDSVLNS